jgi:rRNA-processing protein FCF1
VRTRLTEKRSASRSGEPKGERVRAAGLVLLDTNALFLPFRDRFPLLEEVDRLTAPATVAVPSSVIAELDRLVARRTSGAALARELANRFLILSHEGRGDRGLVDLAAERQAIVVTSDRELRRRLTAAGVAVLSPRGSVRLQRSEPQRPSPTATPLRRVTVKNGAPLAGRPPRKRRHAPR